MTPSPEVYQEKMEMLKKDRERRRLKEAEMKGKEERLLEVIDSVFSKCLTTTGATREVGVFLDSENWGQLLHPIVGMDEDGSHFVMLGKNFKEKAQVVFKEDRVYISYDEDWIVNFRFNKEDYLCLRQDYVLGSPLGIWHNWGVFDGVGVVSDRLFDKVGYGTELRVMLLEKVVQAFGAAAGIGPEDELNEDFPLLLAELKRIKLEKKK